MSHRNAPLTPTGRLLLCQRIEGGGVLAHVAAQMGISRQCATKWWCRYQEFGRAGLVDRSSRAHSSPLRIDARLEANGDLGAVSCVSAKSCRAVGSYSVGGPDRTLAESWNGRVWSLTSSASPASNFNEFDGVSCTGATNCTAVGLQNSGSGPETLIEAVAPESKLMLTTISLPPSKVGVLYSAPLGATGVPFRIPGRSPLGSLGGFLLMLLLGRSPERRPLPDSSSSKCT